MSILELPSATASWFAPFTPRRRFRNGHLQTLAGNFMARHITLPEPESLLVEVEGPTPDYGPSYVLCHCHWQPEAVRARRLTVILVHGLEGSSHSQYMIGNTARALAAGFNVVRMNMRTCGGADDLCPTIYHSGRSGDVGAVLKRAIALYGIETFALVGYSMGGNLVLKFAGEQDQNTPSELKAVVGVSPLMDLAISSAALHEPRNRLYEWNFVRNMKSHFRRRASMYPRLYENASLKGIYSMRAFDERIISRYSGYASADDYYYAVASSRFADRIRVPTLIIQALDDPFIRMLPSTRAALIANSSVTYIETEHGGHCAFLEEPDEGYDGRWAERTLIGFLKAQTI